MPAAVAEIGQQVAAVPAAAAVRAVGKQARSHQAADTWDAVQLAFDVAAVDVRHHHHLLGQMLLPPRARCCCHQWQAVVVVVGQGFVVGEDLMLLLGCWQHQRHLDLSYIQPEIQINVQHQKSVWYFHFPG